MLKLTDSEMRLKNIAVEKYRQICRCDVILGRKSQEEADAELRQFADGWRPRYEEHPAQSRRMMCRYAGHGCDNYNPSLCVLCKTFAYKAELK